MPAVTGSPDKATEIREDQHTGPSGPHIHCPLCAWAPQKHHQWTCQCGHSWNTFDTGGVCPGCLYQWQQTQCLACGQWSAHSAWYHSEKEAGRAFGFVKVRMPLANESVTRQTFSFRVEKSKLQKAQQRDGHYLLRSNLTAEDAAVLWTRYVQPTQIEAVFRSLKSDLGIRPIYHRLESRVDAHILIAFLAYCLQVTLKNRLQIHAPRLTPTAVLEKLGTIQMIDVWIPTPDGRWLILPRHTQPAKDLQLLLEQIRLNLPSQPPPRITASALPTAPTPRETQARR